jgi:hypothetical protein
MNASGAKTFCDLSGTAAWSEHTHQFEKPGALDAAEIELVVEVRLIDEKFAVFFGFKNCPDDRRLSEHHDLWLLAVDVEKIIDGAC